MLHTWIPGLKEITQENPQSCHRESEDITKEGQNINYLLRMTVHFKIFLIREVTSLLLHVLRDKTKLVCESIASVF